MKKNDLVKVNDNYYRIISFNGNKMLVIDCVKRTMPTWIDKIEAESISEDMVSAVLRSLIPKKIATLRLLIV